MAHSRQRSSSNYTSHHLCPTYPVWLPCRACACCLTSVFRALQKLLQDVSASPGPVVDPRLRFCTCFNLALLYHENGLLKEAAEMYSGMVNTKPWCHSGDVCFYTFCTRRSPHPSRLAVTDSHALLR